MPITAQHSFTSPLADGTNTQLVRPSNWNASHLITFTPTGAELIGAFSNGGNVTFGTDTAGYITATAPAGGGGADVTYNLSGNTAGTSAVTGNPLYLQGGNNLTLSGTSNTIVFSAANQSVDTGKAGTGFTSTTTAGTAVVGTLSTDGLSLGVPTIITNALTTARASNDAVGLNTALTAGPLAWTVNSSGISLNASSAAGTTSGFTGGASISGSMTHNTAGLALSLSHPAWLTTQSGQAFSADASSTFQTLTFQDSNGVSFSNNAGALRVTHDLQYTSNTSAITSNALNTSASKVAGIIAGTNQTAGTATLTGNVSFSNANGVSFYTSAGNAIVASVAAAGGAQTGISSIVVSNTTYTSGQVSFSQGNGVSFASGAGQAISVTHDLQYTSNTSAITSNALNTSAARVQAIMVGTATNAATNQTSTLSGTLTLSNLNGFSFYTTASGATSGIAASYTVPTVTNSSFSLQDSATTINPVSRIAVSTGNNITLTLSTAANAGTIGVAHNLAGTSTGFGGNLISGSMTHNSSGLNLSLSHPAWLTTAMQSNESHVQNIVAATNNTGGGTASQSGNVSFSAANGLTFYTSAGGAIVGSYTVPTVTNSSFSVQDSATTINPVARVAFSTGNNITLTLSTGASSATVGVAHNLAGTSTGFTGGASISGSMTHNSSGLAISLSHPAWLTTAAQSSASNVSGVIAGTASNAATNQSAQLSGAVSFANGSGVSFFTTVSGATSGIAATVKTDYLTTARASTDAIGLNTAQTNVTWTVNSSGLSLNAAGYAGTGTTFNGTNASATMTLNSNGLRLDLSAAAGGGGGTQSIYAVSNTTQSTSNTYTNALSFAGAGIASVGVSNGSVVISVPSGGGAGDGVNIIQAGTTGTTGTTFSSISGTVFLNGGNNITVSQNNSNQLVISAPSGGGIGVSIDGNTSGSTGAISDQMVFVGTNGIGLSQSTNAQSATISIMNQPMGDLIPYIGRVVAVQQIGQNTVQVQPMGDVPYITFDRIALGVQQSNATNSTGTISCTVQMGVYTKNASTLSLLTSHSGSFSVNASGTASSSANQGLRYATMTLNGNGSMYGDIWLAFVSSTATAGANASLSNVVVSAINSTWSGYIGVGSNNTNQSVMGMGVYTATSAALPSSIAFTQINGNSSAFQRPQLFILSNGAFI